jgi:putative Mg2+ transporter-C (MgtC) family protein
MELQTFAIDVGVAFLLGLAMGLEREVRHHEAGLRTNALVCLGAALFVSISRMLEQGEGGRIAAQVVTGVGFVAGGVIIRDGFTVRGLNTAGTLWCAAAVGTLAGAGFLLPAALGAAAVVSLHTLFRPFTARFDRWVKTRTRPETEYRLRVTCATAMESAVRTAVLDKLRAEPGFEILGVQSPPSERAGERAIIIHMHALAADDLFVERTTAGLLARDGVSGAGWERLANQ